MTLCCEQTKEDGTRDGETEHDTTLTHGTVLLLMSARCKNKELRLLGRT